MDKKRLQDYIQYILDDINNNFDRDFTLKYSYWDKYSIVSWNKDIWNKNFVFQNFHDIWTLEEMKEYTEKLRDLFYESNKKTFLLMQSLLKAYMNMDICYKQTKENRG